MDDRRQAEGFPLVLRRDGGLRHFIDGAPVETGRLIDLLLPDGRWLSGRYECDLFDEETASSPMFHSVLGGPWEKSPPPENGDHPSSRAPRVFCSIPPGARVRFSPRG